MDHETANGFLIFVVVYVFGTFLAVVPHFFCGRSKRDPRQRHLSLLTAEETGRTELHDDHAAANPGESRVSSEQGIELLQTSPNEAAVAADASLMAVDAIQTEDVESKNEVTETAGMEMPVTQFPPDFSHQVQQQQLQETRSAATTSRLQRPKMSHVVPPTSSTLRSVVVDVAFRIARPKQHLQETSSRMVSSKRRRGHPSITSQRSMLDERLSSTYSEEGGGGGGSAPLWDRSHSLSWTEARRPRPQTGLSTISHAASNVLQVETVVGESDYYRNRHLQRSHQHLLQRSLSNGNSDRSLLPGLPMDALSPDDAADANDPGRSNSYMLSNSHQTRQRQRGLLQAVPCAKCGDICDLIEPDYEARQILWLVVPSIVVSSADPFLRIVLISIISYFVNVESMIAFVLVNLFIRLTTDEISSVVVDVETNMMYDAMDRADEEVSNLVGSHLQLAVFMQVITLLPILLLWVLFMEDVVSWICSYVAPEIASLAFGYTKIIVADYLVRACCRAFMVTFCLQRHPTFDRYIEVIGTVLTLMAIVLVVRLDQAVFGVSSLSAIAILQVVASVVKTLVKIACVVYKGMLLPYQDGFFSRCSFLDLKRIGKFYVSAVPLFVGSLFELNEWQLLTLYMRTFGLAGVAAWAVMGAIWELLESFAECLGDAGATRVGQYLAEDQPEYAARIAYKVVFLAIIQALAVGSLLLMIGPNLSVLLTSDPMLQNVLEDLFPMTVLANFSMTLAQVYWSLIGAQGRFMVASGAILFSRWIIVFPIAAICVFGFSFDLDSVAGSIAVGYATAALILAGIILKSAWPQFTITGPSLDQHDCDVPIPMDEANDGYLDEAEAESDESPL